MSASQGALFQFGRKDKVNQIHQELEIQITQRTCLLYSLFLIVFMTANLVLSVVYFVLRRFIDIGGEDNYDIECSVFDGISVFVSLLAIFVGVSARRSLDKMDKFELKRSSTFLIVLSVILGLYSLVYGGVFSDYYMQAFKAYGLPLSVYILVVVFLSSLVFFAVLAFYIGMYSLTENITNYYSLNKHQGAVYKDALKMI